MADSKHTYSFRLDLENPESDQYKFHQLLQFTMKRLEHEADEGVNVGWKAVFLELFREILDSDRGEITDNDQVTVGVLREFGAALIDEFVVEMRALGVTNSRFHNDNPPAQESDKEGDVNDEMLDSILTDFTSKRRPD